MSKKIIVTLGWAIALGLLTSAVPGHWAMAQDGQTETSGEEQNEQQQTKSEEKDQTGAEQSENSESDEADATPDRQNTLEGFVPSEQISEDLSVSFPVDI